MSKLVALTVAAATLATSALAHADDNDDPPGMNQAPGMSPTISTSAGRAPKDEDTAFALSLGGTAASAVLTIAGFSSNNGGLAVAGLASSLVTPSLGEWYAGKPVTAGMGIRAAAGVVTIVGFGEALSCLDYEGEQDCHTPDSAGYLMLGGLAGFAVGTIYDIATAKSAAREYNEAHGWRVSVSPTAIRTPSGQSTMGVGIGGSF